MSPARPGFVLWCLLLCLAALPAARAGRPVSVYDVTVQSGADPSAVVQDAMREVLVRSTGREDAATDPALAALVAHASDYVRSSRPAGDGATQVTFDGTAIERQITAAGRSVWDPDRPFTIVVLSPTPTGAADDETRRLLEQIAERRGLPVSLVPMPVADSSGAPLSADALLTSARRLGGDAVLVGRSDDAPPGGQWQWTLITGLSARSWNGPFEAGVNGAADALARVEGGALPLTEEEAVVRVSGVGTLSDYATVERTLGELPGVRRSGLAETDGNTVVFHVLIRGGAQAVERALANAQHLTRVQGPGDAGTGTAAGGPSPLAGPAGTAAGGADGGGPAEPLAYQYHP